MTSRKGTTRKKDYIEGGLHGEGLYGERLNVEGLHRGETTLYEGGITRGREYTKKGLYGEGLDGKEILQGEDYTTRKENYMEKRLHNEGTTRRKIKRGGNTRGRTT